MNSQEQLVAKHFMGAEGYAEYYQGCSPVAHLFSTRLERVNDLLGDINQKKVLDVGCGPGMTADHIISRDCQFFGVDLSKYMIGGCQRKLGHIGSVHLSVGNMKMLPYSDASFDIILSLGAIEYVDDASVAIQEISRLLKKNGFLIISMQNKLSPYRLWELYIYRSKLSDSVRKALKRPTNEEPGLRRLFTLQCFRELLNRSQLKISDIIYYDFNVWLPPLDSRFPRLSVLTSRKLESLYQTKFKGLGTGFIVKAEKML